MAGYSKRMPMKDAKNKMSRKGDLSAEQKRKMKLYSGMLGMGKDRARKREATGG